MKRLAKHRKKILFTIDALMILGACIFMFMVLPRGLKAPWEINWVVHSLAVAACVSLCRIVFKTYESIWRYADTREYLYLSIADFCGLCLSYLVDRLFFPEVPFVYLASACMLSLLAVLFSRFSYRHIRLKKQQNNKRNISRTPVAIVGAGYAGTLLVEEILRNKNSCYIPYCFFDDDKTKIGQTIHGVKVLGSIDQIPHVLKNTYVREIIIAVPSVSPEKMKEMVEVCAQSGCKTKMYEPLFDRMDKAEAQNKQTQYRIRDIQIKDLLYREEQLFDLQQVRDFIAGKVILVTGGGGSIGSELCRQIASMKPEKLIVLDIYENNAYDIQQELIRQYGKTLNLFVEIVSIRDVQKVDRIFQKYKPHIVFHAAAHKHVPLMEDCCDEAVKNNVFGTLNVVNAAEKHGVEKMILISSDKAVNPTNVMGATKRLCEMIILSKKKSTTEFVAVRFGNVLGSNGSVIPLFKKQMESGGPITITDKRITRYFMTIPEAVNLVMQASAMAAKSEIFVLDMGKPVRIIDLAEKMIQLAGLRPYKDIDIVEIGLRPGEKLYEELLMTSEELDRTPNKKIFIERDGAITMGDMAHKLEQLLKVIESGDNRAIKAVIKKIVPTYREQQVHPEYDRDEIAVSMQEPAYEKVLDKEKTA